MKNLRFFGLTKSKEYQTRFIKIKLNGKLPAKNLFDYYIKYFEQSCHCSHDCCGHWFSNLVYIKRAGTTITMKLTYSRNY